MEKYIPLCKRTKKEQKEYHKKYRRTWNEINPVTRSVPNGKGYNRKKLKNEDRRNGRLSTEKITCHFYCFYLE